ncbi:hypothetical protein [Rhizobium rhizophilum]|uniref:hypothetical protein n=1 Tax=Rhizobium rhizophilum TaxID=1850373 RepID=UPI0014562C92|nr:hypothetical protein [Rhizobium rhizophilum]
MQRKGELPPQMMTHNDVEHSATFFGSCTLFVCLRVPLIDGFVAPGMSVEWNNWLAFGVFD